MRMIKNVGATSELACSCGSWLRHWQKFSKQEVAICVVDSCLKTELVGAHVEDLCEAGAYILPICTTHNQSSEVLVVADAYVLVPANPKLTCARV